MTCVCVLYTVGRDVVQSGGTRFDSGKHSIYMLGSPAVEVGKLVPASAIGLMDPRLVKLASSLSSSTSSSMLTSSHRLPAECILCEHNSMQHVILCAL